MSDLRKAAALDDALTYCRVALVALDLHRPGECEDILVALIDRLIDAGARDFMEDDA